MEHSQFHVAYLSDAFAARERFGLARYAWSLYDALVQEAADIRLTPVALAVGATGTPRDRLHDVYGLYRVPGGRKVMAGLWATLGYPRLERFVPAATLVHSVELGYPVATKRPWVVTHHDIGPLTHPEFFSTSRPWLKEKALREAARRAAKLLAVSEATADAVEGYLGRSLGDRLQVIGEGVDEVFFQTEAPAAVPLLEDLDDTPFYLWTGSLNPRKNLGRVLDAFEKVALEVPHHLVLVGGLGWDTEPFMERLRASPVADRVHRPGYVTDAQLRTLYRRAAAFVYVSLLEGFGLPILEAMACGCPVITSNTSSMPEVAGDAALLVDPLSADAIAGALLEVAQSSALEHRLVTAGCRRAAAFQWADVAQAVSTIYREVG